MKKEMMIARHRIYMLKFVSWVKDRSSSSNFQWQEMALDYTSDRQTQLSEMVVETSSPYPVKLQVGEVEPHERGVSLPLVFPSLM